MTITVPDWLLRGKGTPPDVRWSFTLDAPLVSLTTCSEAGITLAADESGGLYLFNRKGRVESLSRGFQDLRQLAWSERGNSGIAILGDSRLVYIRRDLSIEWSLEISDSIYSAHITPFGEHILLTMSTGFNYLLRSDKKRLCRFETPRPVRFGQFLHRRSEIVVAAEYGFLGVLDLSGRLLWEESIWSNVGAMSVANDAERIALSVYNHGIQNYSFDGESAGRYLLRGTPHVLALSERGNRLAAATMERDLYWIDERGKLLWAATGPDEIKSLAIDPIREKFVVGFLDGQLLSLGW